MPVSLRVYDGLSWESSEVLGESKDDVILLVGRTYTETFTQIWGRIRVDDLDDLEHIENYVVAGFNIVGAVLRAGSDEALSICKRTFSESDAFLLGYLTEESAGGTIWNSDCCSWEQLKSGSVELQVESCSLDDLAANTALLRLHVKQSIPVNLPDEKKLNSGAFVSAVQTSFDRLKWHWFDSESVHLTVANSSTFYSLSSDDMEEEEESDSPSLLDIYAESNECAVDDGKKRPAITSLNFMQHVLPVQFYDRLSGDKLAEKLHNCAPIIQTERRLFRRISIPLTFTVHCVCDSSSNVIDSLECVRLALTRALALCQYQICHLTNLESGDLKVPKLTTFQPLPNVPYLCQLALPVAREKDEETTALQKLHRLFELPTDRPCLRSGVQFAITTDYLDGKLRNVHNHLKNTAKLVNQHLVIGTYTYHHYMQDGMDDNGWGCAYRSLQTICSWFRYQGYTDKLVPTHKQIQQALVDVGDRPTKFVGSRQWIGSLEVSYVLDQILGVECQIVTAQTGADMPDKARQLAVHFDTMGSPVMIGGGVLAHTILGVDFNEDTGDVQWLILDPHYTDPIDDIKTIVKNGWCGWKQPSFWRVDTFYNMCLPKRPPRI